MGTKGKFQTPSAGRWVLQQFVSKWAAMHFYSFKPHQRGGGCCSYPWAVRSNQGQNPVSNPISGEVGAAAYPQGLPGVHRQHVSNPISGEVGAAACLVSRVLAPADLVSNPISGEVGAAASPEAEVAERIAYRFQTPSAGRWVLQRSMRQRRNSASQSFKPHQRGGGCCSTLLVLVVAAQEEPSFKPHQRGGGCCSPGYIKRLVTSWSPVSNPISGEVGAAAPRMRLTKRHTKSFKPHQRGGGCCS